MYCKRCSLYKKTGDGRVENRHQEIAALCFNEKTLGNLISCIPILINKLANPVSSGGGAGYGDVPVPESWITAEPKAQSAVTQQEDTVTTGKNSPAACHKELDKQNLRPCLRGIDYFYFSIAILHPESLSKVEFIRRYLLATSSEAFRLTASPR